MFDACGKRWLIFFLPTEDNKEEFIRIALSPTTLEESCLVICVCKLYTIDSRSEDWNELVSCSFSHLFQTKESVYRPGLFLKSVIQQLQPQMDSINAILEVSIRISLEAEDLCHFEEDDQALVHHLELLRSGVASNVSFMVEGQRFPAHRKVLVTHSKVFERMFQNEMSESKTRKIVIVNTKSEIFDLFLHFLYTGAYPEDFEVYAVHLFVLADKYEVKSLEQLCIAHFETMALDDNSAKILFGLTREYPCLERLKARVVNYMGENLDFLDSEDWKEVEKEDPQAAIELLKLYAKRNLKK